MPKKEPENAPVQNRAADSEKMRSARACLRLLRLLFKHHPDHATEEAYHDFHMRGAA